jgi:hypothetical protein
VQRLFCRPRSEEGEEGVIREVEILDDAVFHSMMGRKLRLYVELELELDRAANAALKRDLLSHNKKDHDNAYATQAHKAATLKVALKKAIADFLTVGGVGAPPERLYGLQVDAGEVTCNCGVTITTPKGRLCSINSAIAPHLARCPSFRKKVPASLAAHLESVHKHNKQSNQQKGQKLARKRRLGGLQEAEREKMEDLLKGAFVKRARPNPAPSSSSSSSPSSSGGSPSSSSSSSSSPVPRLPE